MAKKITGYVKLQVPAGKANPSPPVGPALGAKVRRARQGHAQEHGSAASLVSCSVFAMAVSSL